MYGERVSSCLQIFQTLFSKRHAFYISILEPKRKVVRNMSYGLDWSDQDYNTVKFKYKSYNPNGYWFKLRSSKIKKYAHMKFHHCIPMMHYLI